MITCSWGTGAFGDTASKSCTTAKVVPNQCKKKIDLVVMLKRYIPETENKIIFLSENIYLITKKHRH